MERREILGAVGVAGLSVGGIVLAWQLDEGNISLPGEEADISDTVSRGSRTWSMDVTAGEEIQITVTDTADEAPYGGAFRLLAPDGTEVLEDGPGSMDMVSRTHTAEQTGTYDLEVNAPRTRVRVSVLIQEASA
ncbi:MAG: hypothetical protein U5K37_10390 [Natrialbaceae archaeon]|nr:hypothetical protein [Natrialbaceae archaeon]